MRTDGVGNAFDPYGLRIDHADGPVFANVVSNYLGCPTQILGDGGRVYTSGNAGPGAFQGGATSPNPVPAAFAVTATPIEDLITTLGTVGSPNRTAEDQARLKTVRAALANERAARK